MKRGMDTPLFNALVFSKIKKVNSNPTPHNLNISLFEPLAYSHDSDGDL